MGPDRKEQVLEAVPHQQKGGAEEQGRDRGYSADGKVDAPRGRYARRYPVAASGCRSRRASGAGIRQAALTTGRLQIILAVVGDDLPACLFCNPVQEIWKRKPDL